MSFRHRAVAIVIASGFFTSQALALPFLTAPDTDTAIIKIQSTPGGGDSGGGGAGGGPAAGGGGSGAGGRSTAQNSAQNAYIGVKIASLRFTKALTVCRITPAETLRTCTGQALDAYAADLAKVAPSLPPAMRSIPSIVATAARRVHAARTNREAAAAVRTAVVAVAKTITLLRADDPVALNLDTRAGNLVTQSLELADAKLERATGL